MQIDDYFVTGSLAKAAGNVTHKNLHNMMSLSASSKNLKLFLEEKIYAQLIANRSLAIDQWNKISSHYHKKNR